MPTLITLPIVDMRAESLERSKIVSQALFAEEILVKEERSGWSLITTSDGYEGWAQGGWVERDGYATDVEVSRLQAHVFKEPDTEYGPLLTLPYGAGLRVLREWDLRWLQVELPSGDIAFVQRGDVVAEPFDLLSFSKKFLGLPYTWGGRSSFGFDCSGFVQMLYRKKGVLLPRDARQQICDPRALAVEGELCLGDLIFWGKSPSEIRHVGMFLEKEHFIHTSSQENRPYLRISSLSDEVWSGKIYSYRTVRRWV